jgi:hypothetical protein
MTKYDPFRDPDPNEWLALDEDTRRVLVEDYHRRAKVRLPNSLLHATFHAVVETQIAEGDRYPAKAKLASLMRDGLDRHEAIHAIGSVVSGQMFRAMKNPSEVKDLNSEYWAALERLTAESWLKSGD